MVVIGDVHGNYELLMKLFDILPHDNVCFVGDLIDRGPDSKKVVDFVKNNQYNCVLGNHEDFAVQSYDENNNFIYFTYRLWQSRNNGGWNTLQSYDNLDDFHEHREWFKTLPLTYWVDNKTVVSHSNYLPVFDQIVKEGLKDDHIDHVLWDRESDLTVDYGDRINIIGHTIYKEVTFFKNFICVDTGVNHYGVLSAYDTETKKVYSVTREG